MDNFVPEFEFSRPIDFMDVPVFMQCGDYISEVYAESDMHRMGELDETKI